VNGAALEDPSLVRALAGEFGAQCVVVSIDVKGTGDRARVWSHAGVPVPEPDPVRWAERLCDAGAGEALLQSVAREGRMEGFDLELLAGFDRRLGKPLIVGGGAGSLDDMRAAVRTCHPSGLSVGARFVLHGPLRAVLVTYLDRAELAELEGAG